MAAALTKKELKKTIAQLKKDCKALGLVYDRTTGKCREKSLADRAIENIDAEAFAGLHVPTYSESPDSPKRVHPVAGALAKQIREARPQVSSGALQSKELNTVLSRMLKISDFGPSFHELGRANHYGSDLVESIKEMIRLGAFHGCGTSKPTALVAGMRVTARWKTGGRHYPGQVVRQRADGTCDIRFDDGDTREATPLAEIDATGAIAPRSATQPQKITYHPKEGCWLPVVFPPDLPMPKLGDERVGCKNKDVLTMEPFGVDDEVVRLNILNDAGTIDYWCLSKDFIKHYCSQAMIDNPPFCEWVPLKGPQGEERDMDDSGHGGSCGNLKLLQIPSRGGETWMITVNLGRQLLKAANSRGSLEVSVKRIKQVAVGATHDQAGGASTSHGNTRHWVWGCRGSCKQVQFSRAILEGSCEHMIMKTLNDRNIFPDSLRHAGEWSVLAKDAWKMSAVLRAECFLKEILDDDSLQSNAKLLALYRTMVSYEINNDPSIKVGDWVWVYPNHDRENYSLGRISAKQTTPKEYAKIKLRPDVNVKTLKRLGIKPVIKTIVTNEGNNPARYFPAFVREALMAKGNQRMIRSLQPRARPNRGSMSYEAALSILGSNAYDGDSD